MHFSKKEATILTQLLGGREMYGLEIADKLEGKRKLKLATIYLMLSRLEEKGWVSSRTVDKSTLAAPRKLYQITDAGAAAYGERFLPKKSFNYALVGVNSAQRLSKREEAPSTGVGVGHPEKRSCRQRQPELL